MKKLGIIAIAFLGSTIISNAQPPEFNDLIIYFAEGKYDKCVSKAERYTDKDKTKREPLPYIYMSMSFYEMSKDQKWKEDYPKAYKDALRYAASFRKKLRKREDKAELMAEYEDYFEKLKGTVVEETENYFDEGTMKAYKKVRSNMKKYTSFDPEDPAGHLIKGVACYRAKIKGEAKMDFKAYEEAIKEYDYEEAFQVERRFLKFAMMEYAKLYMEKQPDKARAVMDQGYQWFQEDEEFKALYDEIVN